MKVRAGAATLILLALTASAPPARASAAPIVIAGPAGSVVITAAPFHLSVLDVQGQVVLSEVANAQPAPTPYATEAPSPLGSTIGQVASLASPLVVTVGVASHPTFPASPWEGDLIAGAAAGVQYAATSVRSVAPDGHGGQSLVVGTNDPTARVIDVDVRPDGPLFDISVHSSGGTTPPGASVLLGDSFVAGPDDAFHGFGGRHESTDLRGTTFDSWLEEENLGAGPLQPGVDAIPGTGGSGYLFPNGTAAAYAVQPSFISQRYGFLVDQTELLHWHLPAARVAGPWQVTSASPGLKMVVAPGPPTSSIPALNALTGRHAAPPGWALQPQLDRLIYIADQPAGYQAKVLDDLAHLERGDAHIAAYRIEGWAELPAADLAADIARLRRDHIHPLLYFRAYVGADAGNTEPASELVDAVTHGYLAKTVGGAPYLFGTSFGGLAGIVDFTNPAARAWFAARLTAALELGADGFMTDFGEQVQPDMQFADGETGATMHNRLPELYQQTVAGAVAAFEHSHPGRTVFRYDRASFGRSVRYEAASFPGDETTDWSASSGLASQAPDMLNRGLAGAFGFTTDIGGYEDVTTGATTKELFLRWAEWAVLSPVFRVHGSAGSGTHTPWSYDAQTLAAFQQLSVLRAKVAPLVGRLWASADRTGLPLMTPLWLAYPDDPIASAQQQEWLLGPDVLAAPVVTQGATARTAYLPAGCWTYQPTGARYHGKQSVTVPAPLTTLAWFVRCDAHPFAVPASVRKPVRTTTPVPVRAPGPLAATGGLAWSETALVLLAAAALVRQRSRISVRRDYAPTVRDELA